MEIVNIGEKTWRNAVIRQSFFTAYIFTVQYGNVEMQLKFVVVLLCVSRCS